jgi:hypothetical protein
VYKTNCKESVRVPPSLEFKFLNAKEEKRKEGERKRERD